MTELHMKKCPEYASTLSPSKENSSVEYLAFPDSQLLKSLTGISIVTARENRRVKYFSRSYNLQNVKNEFQTQHHTCQVSQSQKRSMMGKKEYVWNVNWSQLEKGSSVSGATV